jgi:alpha-tubulin suppressor-like RCC1 family protein
MVMTEDRNVRAVFENDATLREFGRIVGAGGSLVQSPLVPSGDDFVQVALGATHGLGLRVNGLVEAWGANDFGQVSVPSGLTAVKSIAAGPSYSLALKQDGSVVGWGAGLQNINFGSLPRDVANIEAGKTHLIMVRSNGVANTIKVWSSGPRAQLLTSVVGGTNPIPVLPIEYAQPVSAVDESQRGFSVPSYTFKRWPFLR